MRRSLLRNKGQLKDAESKYTAAEAIISTKDGRAGLDRVHKAELKKFQELMAEAKSLYDGGKPSDAIAKLQEAQIFQSGNAALHYNLALCYSKLGDRLKAVAEMDQTLGALPRMTESRSARAGSKRDDDWGDAPILTPEAKQKV